MKHLFKGIIPFFIGYCIAKPVFDFLTRKNIYPYFMFFAITTIIYLISLIWWEYWGQFMFNKIIIKRKEGK